jgi:hypothetical protein
MARKVPATVMPATAMPRIATQCMAAVSTVLADITALAVSTVAAAVARHTLAAAAAGLTATELSAQFVRNHGRGADDFAPHRLTQRAEEPA